MDFFSRDKDGNGNSFINNRYVCKELRRYCTFVPPRVRVRATVKLSAAFFHDESSITKGGLGGEGGGMKVQ